MNPQAIGIYMTFILCMCFLIIMTPKKGGNFKRHHKTPVPADEPHI